jgi:hypothetical protein
MWAGACGCLWGPVALFSWVLRTWFFTPSTTIAVELGPVIDR